LTTSTIFWESGCATEGEKKLLAMRLFVYEWTCCLPDAPPSLRREGWAMLWALLCDLRQVPNVHLVTLLHESCERQLPCETYRVDTARQLVERFLDLAASAEGTLVIAPETSQVLLRHAMYVEQAGGRWLGSSVEAIALTTDKCLLGEWWQRQGVPTPTLAAWNGEDPSLRFPAVLKPRDGAGSTATFLVRGAEELPACLAQARDEGRQGYFVVQELVTGQPASVAFLMGPQETLPLVPASQRLSDDGRFRYEGGSLPLAPALARRAVALGRQAVEVVQGLRGYVGVDLMLGEAADGSQDYAIEINPRLTTSYLGLRQVAETNVAEAILAVCRGQTPQLGWRQQSVTFTPDGSVEIRPHVPN
jgi:predicted ATP-grasp superfamily ATP-dependent carboligase